MLPAHLRPWLLAAALVIVGIVYLFLFGEPLTGLVFVVAAALVSLVMPRTGRTPATEASDTSVDNAALEGLARLVSGLGVGGRGIHVPDADGVRLFLPADEAIGQADLPRLDAETTLVRNRPGAFGLALTPPGLPLYTAWVEQVGPPKTGSPEAAAALIKRALPELGLGTDIRVEEHAGRLRIQYRHTRHASTCRKTREDWAPWHLQGGCPVCSLVAVLATVATETPLRYQQVEAAGETISLVLEALPKKSRLGTPIEAQAA